MRNFSVWALVLVSSCSTAPRASIKVEELRSHPGVRLIEDYVSGDVAGRRLRHDRWFANAVIWEDEPAYDRFFVVRGVDFAPLSGDSSSARVQVAYERLGSITNTAPDSFTFEANQTPDVTVFTAVLTDNGWRIAAPQQPFRVMADTLLKMPRLSADSKARLSALLRSAKSQFPS